MAFQHAHRDTRHFPHSGLHPGAVPLGQGHQDKDSALSTIMTHLAATEALGWSSAQGFLQKAQRTHSMMLIFQFAK